MKKGLAILLALMLLAANTAALAQAYAPGSYSAAASGNNGDVTVSVTFTEDAIASIEIVSHNETAGICEPAFERIPAAIVERQSLAVDAIAGATNTSVAILTAVENCVSQAGGDVEALKAVQAEDTAERTTEQLTCDVLVVGSGLSGLMAATAASGAGADVIVLEKLASTGGSAKASEGVFMVVEVEENQEYHDSDFEDTLEDAIGRWRTKMDYAGKESIYPDYDRVEIMFVESMETIDWIENQGSYFYQNPQWIRDYVGMDTLNVDVAEDEGGGTGAAKLIRLLEKNMTANGARLYLETPATELIAENGVVTGAKASGPDCDYIISAKSVILACGGFGANETYMEAYVPDFTRVGYFDMSVSGNTGDGMDMAIAVGAAVYEDNWIIPTFISPSTELIEHNSMFLKFLDTVGLKDPEISADRLVVDAQGNRFMDESSHYAVQCIDLPYYNQAPYYTLYEGLEPELNEILDSGIEIGEVFKADTIGDLALAAGMDAGTLQATVARYDELAHSGVDTDFGKDASHLFPIAEEGPYYLVRFVPVSVGTIGGVKTNEYYQVLGEDGGVIQGLYAVGEMANRFMYNQNYVSGS
ncbi:MAG: FAD-dependent oxidoreductase, partial [Clostridia bacterium]|nr:FAD-dependent oxidoreductase [Clostridia bacterium]